MARPAAARHHVGERRRDPNARVARFAHGIVEDRAVSSAGFATSHAGRQVGMPSVGPYSAKGAKAATRRSSAGDAERAGRARRLAAASCRWRYTTALAGPVAPDVNRIAATSTGDGSTGSDDVPTGAVVETNSSTVNDGRPWRPAECRPANAAVDRSPSSAAPLIAVPRP